MPAGSELLDANVIPAIIAAGVDAVHVEACPPHLLQLQELVDAEERRARSGAPLTVARVLAHDASVRGAAVMDLSALEEVLRPGGQPRPVLMRAVAASAACGEGVLAELVPALLLCSTGLTDQLRSLPFAGADAALREEALTAWQSGDEEPFAAHMLSECAQVARERRMAIRRALSAMRDDESHLAPLGRAAITARRALSVLREGLATSMPTLSEQLECSRPAAGDALERLVEVGLAVEITGRQRDRVYACAHAYGVV
jgi:biotin operon repressor